MNLFTCDVHSVTYLNLEWMMDDVSIDLSKRLSSNRKGIRN
ncbi:DNA damage checkpoint control RAD17 [Gossypium arboreum]|uniref:DNA damage checkpoint control RAD17 n=1 Tax=Gossypium arboreum TaxID=29729 RepID=A0A0B0MGA4_GOSAR|nr:DNA damage checkpoint control RAD17 [Gossypium arboreum]